MPRFECTAFKRKTMNKQMIFGLIRHAILWSVWVKATEETKDAVIKTMTFGVVK